MIERAVIRREGKGWRVFYLDAAGLVIDYNLTHHRLYRRARWCAAFWNRQFKRGR